MEDKRKLANQELEETFGMGILALKPEEPQNFVELSKVDDTALNEPTTMLNNFNVNVNVSGATTTNVERLANEAVKNALPSTRETPEEIKKNSQGVSTGNSQGNSINESVLRSLEREQREYSEIPQRVAPSIPSFNLTTLGIFDTSDDVSDYTYSTSRNKEENPAVKHTYQVLSNVIKHSLENKTPIEVSPQSVIDNSMIVQEIANERYYEAIHNLNVEKNINENYQSVNFQEDERKRQDRMATIDNDKTIQTLANKSDLLKSVEEDDVAEATSVGVGNTMKVMNPYSEKPRELRHINRKHSTIGTTISKINSPPWWRTVLG